MLRFAIALCALVMIPSTAARAQLLIPLDQGVPPGGDLQLTVLQQDVTVEIIDEHATTTVIQVLRNHTSRTLEGTYLFPLPEGGAVCDFATWDDGVRIPGVILEREEARRIYNSIVRRRVDPGLVEEQEGNLFSVQVFPIPPHGTKRLELEFTQLLDVDSAGVHYQFPLVQAGAPTSPIDTFRLAFSVESALPITGLQLPADTLDVAVDRQDDNRLEGHMLEQLFQPSQDFVLEYGIRTEGLGLRALSHHGTDREEDGYFLVSMIPALDAADGDEGTPKDVVLLFDTSYSMMGPGLEGSLKAARDLVASLDGDDRVAAMTFADDVQRLEGPPLAGGAASAERIEQFLLTANMGAGTDLEGGLLEALSVAGPSTRDRAVVLVTDGHQTAGDIDLTAVEARVKAAIDRPAPIFAFSVGDGVEDPLLKRLATASHGHFEHVRGYGDLDYRLGRFLEKLDLPLLTDVKVKVPGKTDRVYPSALADTFVGSRLLAVGRYRRTVRGALRADGSVNGDARSEQLAVSWDDAAHGPAHVARLWARARVDHLLERIHMEGFREEWRDEIVELSRRYKFVTPYTSFLAAPRALLRPRVIKPGDPVLQVRAPADTQRVTVVFPFGETKPAHYDEQRDLWVCRFLVPAGIEDGDYDAIVILTDADGEQVRERKRFVIDSVPPAIRSSLTARRARAGDEIGVRVDAPPDTGRIVASLMTPDGREVLRAPVRWDAVAGLNTGRIELLAELSEGRYSVFVLATDFAYNETGEHVELEVL